ncbi:hypothetical protein C0674_12600 [Sporolactobacillus terrae]|uniref:ABC transporter permease n=1 Tax=Sporolactobacillus terrae TaxID=269673 RepID=A0ABX5Q9L8_9BACL|nr:hypothetical protein C0674_12600 [Sporolactobacillus terrae]QAA26345.1 hypothetical protein C0679_12585 [Sporolactobacillus terrae]
MVCSFSKLRILKGGQFEKKLYRFVQFILLFIASVAGGLALKNIFNYSMIMGLGLGIVFLLCAVFVAGKYKQ